MTLPTVDGVGKLFSMADAVTKEDRLKHLNQCSVALNLTMPAVVDNEDDAVAHAFHASPDKLIVVDQKGKMAFVSGTGPQGFSVPVLEAWLKTNIR